MVSHFLKYFYCMFWTVSSLLACYLDDSIKRELIFGVLRMAVQYMGVRNTSGLSKNKIKLKINNNV